MKKKQKWPKEWKSKTTQKETRLAWSFKNILEDIKGEKGFGDSESKKWNSLE